MAQPIADQEDEAAVAPPSPQEKWWKPWIPLLVAVISAPLLSLGITQFILIPSIQSSFQSGSATLSPPSHKVGGHGASGEGNKSGSASFSVPFDNIVVNLSGAKGTRYLKASFTVVGSSPELKDIITQHRIELMDLTISILSCKTLADLEVPGAKNVLRHDLLENFNQILKSNVVEQLYFSEFVIQ